MRWLQGQRVVSAHHALDQLLDHLETALENWDCGSGAGDARRIGTGIDALDRLLGGGVRRGEVVAVTPRLQGHGRALITTIARKAPTRRLFDCDEIIEGAKWALVSAANVPEVLLTQSRLSELQWQQIAGSISALSDQDLFFSSTGALWALEMSAQEAEADLVLIDRLDRFGEDDRLGSQERALERIASMTARTGLGVVVIAGEIDLQRIHSDEIRLVTMTSYQMGGRASLVRTDPERLLAIEHIKVDSLRVTVEG